MARPRKGDADRRTFAIGVRLTADELAQLNREATLAGLPLAAFVRRRIFSGRVTVVRHRSLDWPVFDQLRRIGVNLNQAMRLANATGYLPPELASAAAAVERFLLHEIERHGPEGRG